MHRADQLGPIPNTDQSIDDDNHYSENYEQGFRSREALERLCMADFDDQQHEYGKPKSNADSLERPFGHCWQTAHHAPGAGS
jgi:hypothetical protein